MRFRKIISAIALAGLMVGAAPITAVAQAQQNAPPTKQVTGEEVDAFVIAYKNVQAIDIEYGAQAAQTTDQAELQVLQEEAQSKKIEAVEATPGIDVDRYLEILTVAQADPDLSKQIVKKLE